MNRGWREKVERDLGSASSERASPGSRSLGVSSLITELAGGLRIQPLYDEGPALRLARSAAPELGVVVLAGEPSPHSIEGVSRTWTLGPSVEPDALVEHGHEVREGGVSVAHALDVHEAGGSVPLEVGIAIARWLDGIRRDGTAGPLAVAVGTETFVEIAKLRALRMLATRAGHALLGEAPSVRILARTSLVPFSRIEPETNALRATLSCVASLIGGADLVATAPFDLLSAHGEHAGERDSPAARLATTTALVAVLESHLAATDDPAHGSYFVETLTRDIAKAAWSITRALEAAGGIGAAPDPWREQLAKESAERARASARAKLPRVGATRLAGPDAPLGAPTHGSLARIQRDATAFEALRDERIARPVTLLVVGDPRKTAARADYVRDVVACWGAGVEVVRFASVDEARIALEIGTSQIAHDAVAICVEDSDFEHLPALARALGPARSLLVAGRPGASEAALREAGVRTFVFVGADLPAVARELFAGGAR